MAPPTHFDVGLESRDVRLRELIRNYDLPDNTSLVHGVHSHEKERGKILPEKTQCVTK